MLHFKGADASQHKPIVALWKCRQILLDFQMFQDKPKVIKRKLCEIFISKSTVQAKYIHILIKRLCMCLGVCMNVFYCFWYNFLIFLCFIKYGPRAWLVVFTRLTQIQCLCWYLACDHFATHPKNIAASHLGLAWGSFLLSFDIALMFNSTVVRDCFLCDFHRLKFCWNWSYGSVYSQLFVYVPCALEKNKYSTVCWVFYKC